MATLDEKQREFLANPFYAVVSTVRDDGSVHNTVVWVDVDDEGVWFNTSIGRAKERHLRNNPNVSIMVVDPANAYRWVSVSGQGELSGPRAPMPTSTTCRTSTSGRTTPTASPAKNALPSVCRPTRSRRPGSMASASSLHDPHTTREEAGMTKNAEKPKKTQKKVAQKTLKEKRSEKKAKQAAR